MKKLILSTLVALSFNAHAANVNVQINPQPAGCRTHTSCNVGVNFKVAIQNTLSTQQTYHVIYQVCAVDKGCKRHEYDVPIAPTHTFTNEMLLNVFPTYNVAGIHQAQSLIQVNGADYNHQTLRNSDIIVN